MEILETPRTEELAEVSSCGAPAPPPKIEEEALDILAFELWQRACRQDAAAEEDCSNDEETVASHASCL
jgi:hypothetical protein